MRSSRRCILARPKFFGGRAAPRPSQRRIRVPTSSESEPSPPLMLVGTTNSAKGVAKIERRVWEMGGDILLDGGGRAGFSGGGGGSATVGGPVGSPGLLCRYQCRPHFFTRVATVVC